MGRLRRLLGCAGALLFLLPIVPGADLASDRRLIAADLTDKCHPMAVRTATPVGTGSCPGVRPGAFFTSPIGGCSFNFLFKGGDGYRYIGTAGHCLVKEGQELAWEPGKGPTIEAGGAGVGRPAYGILKGERDFGLIRLNADVQASPQMCHFGGPTGLDTARLATPVLIEHYGNGVAVSEVAPARTSVAMNTNDPDVVTALGLAAFGDSGSGATRDGRALGVLVAVGVSSADAGNIFITRLAPQIVQAERVLGTTLTLQTAPRL